MIKPSDWWGSVLFAVSFLLSSSVCHGRMIGCMYVDRAVGRNQRRKEETLMAVGLLVTRNLVLSTRWGGGKRKIVRLGKVVKRQSTEIGHRTISLEQSVKGRYGGFGISDGEINQEAAQAASNRTDKSLETRFETR